MKNKLLPFIIAMFFASCQTKQVTEFIPRPGQMPMEKFIGACSFCDDPMDIQKAYGTIREYHNWSWDSGNGDDYEKKWGKAFPVYPDNECAWAPSLAHGGLNFDDYYKNVKDAGFDIFISVMQSTAWLTNEKNSFGEPQLNVYPIKNPDSLRACDPMNYAEHSDHLFQLAARYGNTKVADSLLKLTPDQPRVSGLGYIHMFQNWNEPDTPWWPGGNFTPEQFAAMSSADYDGHESRLGKTHGIINADPTAIFVSGCVTELSVDWVQRMKKWFEENRTDKKFVFDALAFNHYANENGGQGHMWVQGHCPELDSFKYRVKKMTDYVHKELPGKQVWITEFGYDTHPQSVMRAPEHSGFDQQEVQGQWLLRTYLAVAAGGADRLTMFLLRDPDPNDVTQFSNCGLVGPKGDWKPKKSWYYTYTMKEALKGMYFEKEVETENPEVSVYQFTNIERTKTGYAIWCPTQQGLTVENFEFKVCKDAVVKLITCEPDEITGETTSLENKGGKVLVNVSERPIFVIASNVVKK